MNKTAADILMHVGVSKRDGAPVGSGRYPLGSGENPYQHWKNVTSRVQDLRNQGLKEKEIAEIIFNDKYATTTKLRTYLSMERDEGRSWMVSKVEEMTAKGMNPTEIARELGFKSESSVRSLLNQKAKANNEAAKLTAEYLEKVVKSKGMVDVGAGVEAELNISKEKLKTALEILKLKGYEVYGRGVGQVENPGKQTNIQVLCPPGTKFKEIYDTEKIHSVSEYDELLTDDGQKIIPTFQYPTSLDSKRLKVRYAEEGGIDYDGVIELRRNVPDLDLGNSNYAQVRIMVDGTHYLKGMALYSDNMPDGVDVIFNTNKKLGTPLEKTLKPIKSDPDNPFGSLIKERGGQYYYIDKDGKEKLGLINKTREEGDWLQWSKELPSQFLSKQPVDLIKKQLDVTANERYTEYEKIISLTNPTIKKTLLMEFANECDSAAVHLKAASLPGQKYQVILPLKGLKDTEVYAPNYKDGSTVALIRYPHASITEIPILKVNNKNPEGRRVIGANALDAVGINKNVADRLSGADFDGDTVQVIPLSRNLKVASKPQFKELEGFDTKMAYGPDSTNLSYQLMTKQHTQNQMGRISNLITDMTLKGASEKELAQALKHSMVVIDAEKHKLDYKRSEKDNDIPALKKKYQGRLTDDGRYTESASTLISRAKGETSVVKRKGSPQINQKGKSWYDPSKPEGALLYKEDPDAVYEEKVKVRKTDPKTGRYLKDANGDYVYETTPSGKPVWAPTGRLKVRTQRSTQMAETDDARTLSSGTQQEELYADYANKMKALANRARKEAVYNKGLEYHRSAAETYKEQVDALDSKLLLSEKNAPKERAAQRIASVRIQIKTDENPNMTKEEKKKLAHQELYRARSLVGAKRYPIEITDKEWEAIQSGAISHTKLTRILKHVDTDKLRERATPRENKGLSDVQITLLKSMKNAGYTNAQIAERLSVSAGTVSKYL